MMITFLFYFSGAYLACCCRHGLALVVVTSTTITTTTLTVTRTHQRQRAATGALLTRTAPTASTALAASSLISALEDSLHTRIDVLTGKPLIQWLDPSQRMVSMDNDGSITTATSRSMPLYPLSAITYLPDVTANCTLVNTERRNIQMALDLQQLDAPDRLFCVVLRALDTGRIASVGTVLRVLEMQVDTRPPSLSLSSLTKSDESNPVQRIIWTCVPLGTTVDVVRIENPAAAVRDYQWRHPTEYLLATVRYRVGTEEDTATPRNDSCDDDDDAEYNHRLCQRMVDDYNAVRAFYFDGIGTADLPPCFVGKLLEALPPMSVISSTANLATTVGFWQVVTAWQTLCETVREGRQMALASDRNEILVDAALRQPGPLQLPIHVTDDVIRPADRQRVQALDLQAQQAWSNLQLDPCLDFQVLISRNHHQSRLDYFANMVARERLRLQALAASTTTTTTTTTREQQQQQDSLPASLIAAQPQRPDPPRKGAWFRDDAW